MGKAKKKTSEEKKMEVAGLVDRIEEGIKGMLSSDGWHNWLKFQAIFHQYSLGNCLLIAGQFPEATRVAGFQTWKKAKRWVRKGQKSIKILAPRLWSRTEEDAESGEEVEKRGLYFRAVGVFDVSQTEGEDLPVRPYGLSIEGDEDNGLFASLRAYSEGKGCPVDVEEVACHGALGYYAPKQHRIVIQEGMSLARMAHVLAHEIGHSILHRGDVEADGRNPKHLSRGVRELEAESVAFILCNAHGIDPGASSFGYIADWNGESAAKELHESAKRIAGAAKEVLGSI